VTRLLAAIPLCIGAMCIGEVAHAQAGTGCDEPVSTATLARHISRADVAFARMNESDFHDARFEAEQALICLGAPIQTGQAAAFYRMHALGAFLDGDHARAVSWFRSVVAVAPRYQLPDALAPESHPLRIDFEVAVGTNPIVGDPVKRPASGVIRIDGRLATELPKDRPYVFQHVDEDSRIRVSTIVQTGMAAPKYATGRGLQTSKSKRAVAVTKVRRIPQLRVDIPLIAVAGGAAVLSGVSFALATAKERRFWEGATPRGELEGLRRQTNTWAGIGVGAGAVAAGTGIAAVVVGTW
jgi:hypothetical protein